jgi:uracil-DNA glycosylase
MWNQYWQNRGTPDEYDAGPPSGTQWSDLFAQTPNYRALGIQKLSREAFRWHFGPMFYRGRLSAGSARVLLVGQEGAQDESLGHRSFVGGSGGKMQNFLAWLGITRSYLFLNTFVYPIYGQYTTDLKWLAQNPASPIVQHRHSLFEYLASINNLELVVSIGTAAKDAIATWKSMRGGSLPAGTRYIHVLHPGAAAAGSATAVRTSFVNAVKQIKKWKDDNPGWLVADPDGTPQFDKTFVFKAAPLPFRDLPYGTPWRLGSGGTSSNRRDGQTAIQIFSADGHYNGQGDNVTYSGNVDGSQEGYADESGDLPYEPPKQSPTQFDPGPTAAIASLLMGREPGLDWPDFAALSMPAHPSFGFGPGYRGRFADAVLYVLADQESPDDLFLARAMCGESGQHFQQWLKAAGIAKNYVIVRTLPVNTLGATTAKLNAALDDANVIAIHKALLAKAPDAKALIAIGAGAQRLVANINTAALPVINMNHWTGAASNAGWNQALQALQAINYPKEGSASFNWDGSRGQIARIDLPFGTLRWQGSSGARAQQGRLGTVPSKNYAKIVMPKWAADLDAEPL